MSLTTFNFATKSSRLPVVLDTRVVTGSGGGPDKTILNSPRYLAAAGYRMLCAYMHPPADSGFQLLRSRAKALRAPMLSIPDRGPWDWRVVADLAGICRRERVRIWHGHDYKSNALGLLVKQFWPMRLVTTVHGWVKETRRTPLYYTIDKLCLPRYQLVICVSADLQELCLKAGVPAEHCVVIENGIDASQFTRQMTTFESKQRFGLPHGRFVIGTAARLSAEKGIDGLIRATHRLLALGHDVGIAIAGDGEEKERLQSLCESLGMSARVRFLGYLSELREYYEGLDLFALNSSREGLPNVLLEAMAMEVPVVATRVGGIPQLITNGENGLLVQPGADGELAHALQQLLSDDSLRARFGSAGRRTIETRYNFATRINKISAFYDNLLSCR
jgi:glycosyltransferase involved in cell wall biosynthesis